MSPPIPKRIRPVDFVVDRQRNKIFALLGYPEKKEVLYHCVGPDKWPTRQILNMIYLAGSIDPGQWIPERSEETIVSLWIKFEIDMGIRPEKEREK